MIKLCKNIIKLLEFFLNILFILQIATMIVVFITATYWFLSLIGSTAFDFAQPLADVITDFVRIFYTRDIEVGGQYIDGALLLFDILAIIAVFLVTKSKYYIYLLIEYIEDFIKSCLKNMEDKFNKELQEEFEAKIRQSNNVAILVQFEVRSLMVDCKQDNSDEKAEEAFKIFYSALKVLSGCKFAKTEDKMLILSNDFSNVDNLLNFVDLSINKIKINFKKDKWILTSYIGVEVYDSASNFKSKVYPILKKLVELRQKNEAICLGSFNLRYNINPEQMFKIVLKGVYNIEDDSKIYSIVKKD